MANRPTDDYDDVQGLNDINDIRNGIFVSNVIHSLLDQRFIAILKVCVKIIISRCFV